ncbi:polymer-forming cytoskeletal protein [Chitinimonas taiwanensis]|uniref:Protein CcmA, bactofilin family n=1 Tax=Chitinimonas taiwanensis DSM 18899 TaxID=1121279 RepID=A0A1K2HAY9_9NEIS|nr:polymer-forming cytoskeletal protein [Chitinimonas taiwanensis]SFZ73980.1 protein CcmA, bactofilin family [Chitinimonas taiwanensis DSM 18899]
MFNKTSPLARHNANGNERDSRASSTTAGTASRSASPSNPYAGLAISEVSAPSPAAPALSEPVASKPEATSAREAGSESPSRLIVGPNVKLKGAEILDCDTLVVEGRVEATMDSRVLRISEHGAFSGKVSIDIAEIDGHFEGDLTVRQQLIVHATGRVSGTIRYGKILVEEGGELSGDVRSLSAQSVARPEVFKRSEGLGSHTEAANGKAALTGTLG